MRREHWITKELQRYDSKLFAMRMDTGNIGVFRKAQRLDRYALDSEVSIVYVKESPHYIFALTHDWTPFGTPVEWSRDKIKFRLQRGDLWNNNIVDESIAQNEKNRKSKEHQNREHIKDIAREFRPAFAKATNDINTSILSKGPTRNQLLAESRAKLGKE